MAITYADVERVQDTAANIPTVLRSFQFGYVSDTEQIAFKDDVGSMHYWDMASSSNPTQISLTDNTLGAYYIKESTNTYFQISTSDGNEAMNFGNTTTNPIYSFFGDEYAHFYCDVGIGIAPTRTFQVSSGTTDNPAIFGSTDNRTYITIADDDTNFHIGTEDGKGFFGSTSLAASQLSIDFTSGYMGLGYVTPESLLHLYSTTAIQEPRIILEGEYEGTEGPAFDFYHNSVSPAIGDRLGFFRFDGRDSLGDKKNYGDINAFIIDPLSTARESAFTFRTYDVGVLVENMRLQGKYVGIGTTSLKTWRSSVTAIQVSTQMALWESSASSIIGDNVYEATDTNRKHINTGAASYYQQTGGEHIFYSATSQTADTNFTGSLVKIDSSGNVGIGTSAPNVKLDVKGAAGASATYATAITAVSTAGATSLYTGQIETTPYAVWIQTSNTDSDAVQYPLSLNPLGGNVGIGTLTPAYKLDVAGTLGVTGLLTASGNIVLPDDGTIGSVSEPDVFSISDAGVIGIRTGDGGIVNLDNLSTGINSGSILGEIYARGKDLTAGDAYATGGYLSFRGQGTWDTGTSIYKAPTDFAIRLQDETTTDTLDTDNFRFYLTGELGVELKMRTKTSTPFSFGVYEYNSVSPESNKPVVDCLKLAGGDGTVWIDNDGSMIVNNIWSISNTTTPDVISTAANGDVTFVKDILMSASTGIKTATGDYIEWDADDWFTLKNADDRDIIHHYDSEGYSIDISNATDNAYVNILGTGGLGVEGDIISYARLYTRGRNENINDTVKTANYTLLSTDENIFNDTTSSSFWNKLPATPTAGDIYTIFLDTAVEDLTIDGNGKNINGSSTVILSSVGSVTVIYNGTQWMRK